LAPILVIFAGLLDRITVFKLKQFLKVELLIILILGGIVIDNKLEHPKNTDDPIILTLSGIEMEDKLVQFLKELSFIEVTPCPITTFLNAVFIISLL
jgi:hypothetical protein